MKKRLVSAAVTVALFIGLIAGVTFKASDKKEIKHFTAFFPTEGNSLEYGNIMKAKIARGADFENGNLIQKAKNMVPLLVPLFI